MTTKAASAAPRQPAAAAAASKGESAPAASASGAGCAVAGARPREAPRILTERAGTRPGPGGGRTAGCRTCSRRRIRCDLGRPACNKCSKRGLDCPGYGPRLRWAGGVAVRGRLKGLNVPVAGRGSEHPPGPVPGPPPGPPPTMPVPEVETGAGQRQPGKAAAEQGQPGKVATEQGQPDKATAEQSQSDKAAAGQGQPDKAAAAAAAMAVIRGRPKKRPLEEGGAFIEYYDKNIAGLMVWLDSDDNDYRRRVLPLAANAPGLRLAVAAISAHHGGLALPGQQQGQGRGGAAPRFSEAARDACLGLIRARVGDMTGRLTSGAELTTEADLADAEWMLAAILIISTYEMANAQAAAAESHRRAARSIVSVFGRLVDAGRRARVFDFLRSQMSVLDILCSTTSFDLADVEGAVMPPPSLADGLFAQFLALLHRVTVVSRRRGPWLLSSSAPGTPSSHHHDNDTDAADAADLSARAVRSGFQQATSATLLAAGRQRQRVQATVVGRDFVRLVHIYHDAAILYSYRSLGHAGADEGADGAAARVKLFEGLAALEAARLCAQNLPWPAFVAGTECHGDAPRQRAVADLFAMIADATGFRHFLDVLDFLRAFWAGAQPDWRPLARDLQAKGLRILAV